MEYKDYYAILGVSRDADEQTIKSAYRRMARTYHPDVNPDKATATERFKEINEAYAVLGDTEKRRRYDSFGARYEQVQQAARQSGGAYRPSPAGPGRSGFGSTGAPRPGATGTSRPGNTQSSQRTYTRTIDPEDLERIFRGFGWSFGSGSRTADNADFSDFFEALFGGRRPGTTAPAVRDVELDLVVTLDEAFNGATRTLRYNDGRQLEVTVPRGVDTGSRLRVRGQGERAFARAPGDLYLNVKVQPHAVFARQGDDLRIKMAVAHEVAQRSGQVQVPTLGRPVMLKIPVGTQTGQIFRLNGLGMPSLQDAAVRGDLLVEVEIKPPAPNKARTAPPKAERRPKPAPQAAAPGSATASYAKVAGVALMVGGLVGVAFQTLSGTSMVWLVLMALALLMLSQAVNNRSLVLLVTAVVAGAAGVWFASQTGLALAALAMQGWPLLPLAAGLAMLPRRPKAKPTV